MAKKLLVRSASDSHLFEKPFCKRHHRQQIKTRTFAKSRLSSDEDIVTFDQYRNDLESYDSYWSPAISQLDLNWKPIGSKQIKCQWQIRTTIFVFLNLNISSMQIKNIYSDSTFWICSSIFYFSALLAALIAPILLNKMPERTLIFLASLYGILHSLTVLFPHYYITLPVYLLGGWLSGLIAVLQGSGSLNCGLQYACNKDVHRKKDVAGDWYLWTQVLVQLSVMVGSIGCSAKMWLMPDKTIRPIVHPLDSQLLCGKHVCRDSGVIIQHYSSVWRFPASSPFQPQNKSYEAEKDGVERAMIDGADHQLNMILFVITLSSAILATLCAGAFCWLNKSRTLRNRSGGLAAETGEELLSVSDATQIYTPSIKRQFKNQLDRLLFDHKLQTILPMCAFIAMQNVFIKTTFAKDFVACALSSEYTGWTNSAQTTASVMTLLIVYKLLSPNIKRLHILFWLIFFQLGISVVVFIWPPGNHDVPMFFIVPAVFGIIDGGLTALISGLLIHVFAYDWIGVFSFMTASQFTGYALGLLFNVFLCNTSQMCLLVVILLIALIPYGLIEWKYDTYLMRKGSHETFL